MQTWRPKRYWKPLLALLALMCLSVFIFKSYEPWRSHPWVNYIKTSFCTGEGLVQPIYVEGRQIGVFIFKSSLQESYDITVSVEKHDATSSKSKEVFNITFHAPKASDSTSSTSSPLSLSTPLPASSPGPPVASKPVLTSSATTANATTTTTTASPDTTHYICPSFMGRLGNQIFIFASSFGLAAQRNMSLMLQNDSPLWKLFTVTASSVVNVTSKGNCEVNVASMGSGACCKYNSQLLEKISGKQNVKLGGHLQSYRYFESADIELRKALTVTPENQNKSSQALLKALLTRYNSSQQWQGRTFVGMHVRRGDFLTENSVKYGHVAADKDYYARAMTYFDSHFPNVTFVVCSDTLAWARDNVRHNHSVVVDSGSELVDFAVLTRMNHTLMSTGSFSWWAAWLANGTAVYLGQLYKPGSSIASQFNPKGEDYILPRWIPL